MARKKKDKPKKIKVRAPKPDHFSGGGKTKCRFCRRVIPLANAWNCCYSEKYATAQDFINNKMIVTPLEDVDIQEVVEEDGQS